MQGVASPTVLSTIIALGSFTVVWILGRLVKRFAYARYTIVNDLPALGGPRRDGKLGQTAVVCGGR
jgi:hypothetical protein